MIRAAVILFLLQLASCLQLPADWKKCHLSDPEKNACLREAVQDVIIKIGNKGVSSLGTKSLDPLEIGHVTLRQSGSRGPVSLRLALHDAVIHGLASSLVSKFDGHLDKYIIDGESLTPSLQIDSGYSMSGQILVLPVTGKGRCNITMADLKVTHDIVGKPVERDGKLYMELQKYTVTLKPKRLHAHFSNLFNGDKRLGFLGQLTSSRRWDKNPETCPAHKQRRQTLNKVINENWELIFNELKPSLERELSSILLEYAQTIFHNVAFEDIFLE